MDYKNLCKAASDSRQKLIPLTLAILMIVAVSINVSHADLTEMTKLANMDAQYADFFGSAVSVRGNYAIVGAPSDDEMFRNNTGSASVFQLSGSTWALMGDKLVAVDGQPNDTFGSAVSISGDYAIVGVPFASYPETLKFYGAAYIYRRVGDVWVRDVRLTASDKEVNDYFATSVWIAGDYAIVGAPFDDDNGQDSGSAYIFERSAEDGSWSQVKKLVASDGAAGDHFGNSVSISGNYAVVGAHSEDNSMGVDAGSVYFFQRSEGVWGDEQKLVDINGDDVDAFGRSVAIYGRTAIVGADQHDDESGDNTGSATIVKYWNNTWLPSAYLKAPDREALDYFGFSVSISADTVVIGAFNGDGMAADSGAAYVFQKTSEDDTTPVTGWDLLAKLIASDGAAGDKFGYSVSISGPYALIGATQDNNSAGSAYMYDIFPGPSPGSGSMPGIPLLLLDD